MTTSQTGNEMADLLAEAARVCADDAQTALTRLLTLAREALGTDAGSVFRQGGERLTLAAGPDRDDLRWAAEACLSETGAEAARNNALRLTAGGETVGVWAVSPPDAADESRWP